MIVSIAVGTAMAASLITLSLEINGKIARELRAFGANILVEPEIGGLADITGQRRYLRFEDVIRVKTIFWRHNIVGIAPFLETGAEISRNGRSQEVTLIGAWYEKEFPLPGEKRSFASGIRTVSPWWNVEGKWPDSPGKVVVGSSLAAQLGMKLGDPIQLDGKEVMVSGTLETGGIEDTQVFMDLESLQEFKDMKGKVSRVFVSALTTPMDAFAYKDPNTMSRAEYEKWYCTGYVTSIAKQIEEVLRGSKAKPIWQVAETEGKVLGRLKLLIYLLCVIALAASAVGVSTTMVMSLLRRIEEIGLMKAIGADRERIITLFLSEGIVIGLTGGLLGYLLSVAASHYIGFKVFHAGLDQRAILLPIAIGSAIFIAVAGTILPIRKALSVKPNIVLRGGQ